MTNTEQETDKQTRKFLADSLIDSVTDGIATEGATIEGAAQTSSAAGSYRSKTMPTSSGPLHGKPKSKWYTFKPFGLDVFCTERKFLVFNLVARNIKLKYRRSYLGVLWTMVIPALTSLVYYMTFQIVMKVPVPNYVLFIVCGILPWACFSATLQTGMESIFGQHQLLSKVPIPLHIFPFVDAVSNYINLLLSLPIVFAIAFVTEAPLGWPIVLLPYFLGLLFLATYGFTLFLSVAFIYLRDLRHLLGVVMHLWVYLTPIIYSQEMIPEKFRILLYLNPVASIFVSIQRMFVYGQWPVWEQAVAATLWSLFIFFSGVLFFKFQARDLVERV